MELSITFARGARRVTGSNFLVTITNGEKLTKILIDCGLSQGETLCDTANTELFAYDPKTVDAIFFTHAHADHIGLFPKLVNEGFNGKAYATKPTKELMPIMLEDSASVMQMDADKCKNDPPYKPDDVGPAVALVEELELHKTITVGDAHVTLFNAGHIIGSALIVIEAAGKRVLFTGDLGRMPAVLVPDPEIPENIDVLVTESVYGNRVHGNIEHSFAELEHAAAAAAKQSGVLLIPAFSLERTQIILSGLDRMIGEKKVPTIPVYLDSPLAAKVTEVYQSNATFLRDDVRKRIDAGDDPFSFPSLKVTVNQQASHTIDNAPTPKIIIAGAGMSHGGRIRHHEVRYLGDPKSSLLLVGYQVPGSLGRKLKDGKKKVTIDGTTVHVRGLITTVDGFSAHADRDDLIAFAERVKPKRAFVVLGETEASVFLAQRISGFLNIPTDVPREGETYTL